MLPINKKISKFNHYDGGNSKKYIVIHDVGALGQAKANVDYFSSQNRGASAHYFIDPTSIWQSVEDNDRAWHVGDDKAGDSYDVGDLINNHNTIGLEMCLNSNWKIEASTKQHTAELVKYLQKKYNIPNSRVVRHYDASGKNCPGSMSGNNWAEWKAFYKQVTGFTAVSNPPQVNTPNSHTVVNNDTLWGLSRQYNVTVAQLKSWNNLKSDTIVVGQKLAFKAGQTATNNPTSKPNANLKVDGYIGKSVVSALQTYFGTPVDGVLSNQSRNPVSEKIEANAINFNSRTGSVVIRELQKLLGITADGLIGSSTVKALQKRFGTPQDGILSSPSMVVKELQRRLNTGKL